MPVKILLIAYDNGSHISYFPLGLAYIASACRNAGHEVNIYSQDVYHWPEEHLTTFLDSNHFDVVGMGVIGGYYQYRKLLKISDAINKSRQRPFFIIGGHGPSPEPEYFLRKTGADVVVIGEGEVTIVELLNAHELGKKLFFVKGIAFIDAGTFIQTPPRPLIQDIDNLPLPAWDLFPIEHHVLFRVFPETPKNERCITVATGRGCNFKCNFCYRMDKGLRIRSDESIVTEIKLLKKLYGIKHIIFWDELFMDSIARVKRLCNLFLEENLNISWECQGRLNYANEELLTLMKKAGCMFVNYGIESLDNQILRIMHKALTVEQIIEGVENTLTAGISPGLNIIFGNIGETEEILWRGVDFLLRYDNHAQLRTIRPVAPYPGSPLYYYAIKHGLLEGPEDFYERKLVNSDLVSVNFTHMPDEEVHRLLFEANKILIEKYFRDKKDLVIKAAEKLYLERDISFRGFR
jgi:radical SAM superfamily enzyme YgiQ (UPF0313 family)